MYFRTDFKRLGHKILMLKSNFKLVGRKFVRCFIALQGSSTKRIVGSGYEIVALQPLTYTYLDCLLAVKMRGHKMAEI